MSRTIDIGVNLSNPQFNQDRYEIIKKSFDCQVDLILTTTSPKSFFGNLEILNNIEKNIHMTYGLHPHSAKELPQFITDTQELFQQNKHRICAIGEYGLDYDRMFSPKNTQLTCMEHFIEIAKNEKKPSFLHERKAEDDFISILKPYAEQDNVVHCFTGNKKTAKKYLDLNCHIGITGWICDERRNQDLIEAVEYIPLDRLMVETDAPYLKPRNCKVKSARNEPYLIFFVIEKIAEIKKIHKTDLTAILYDNTKKFFRL